MRVFHIGNTAGVGSVLAKFMDRILKTVSFVAHRSIFDPYGLTTYGELWNDRARIFIWKCLWKARKFDILHVHSYEEIVPSLKILFPYKPVILHYHGSEIRNQWDQKKQYWSKADLILYSTLDLFNDGAPENAIYMPNPVDSDLFYPKAISKSNKKIKILIASSARKEKGTDIAIKALSKLKDKTQGSIMSHGIDYDEMIELSKSLELDLHQIPIITHVKMREHLWNYDLIFDQFRCGVVGKIFLEAIASGRPAISYISSAYSQYNKLPLKDIDTSEKLVKAIEELDDLTNIWEAQYDYITFEHNVNTIIENLFELYEDVLDGK